MTSRPRQSRTSGQWIALRIALAALFLGCVGGESESVPRPTHDLLAELPVAELATELDRLDFGDSTARPFLISGWSRDEAEKNLGRSYVWGVEERSEIALPVFELRDLVLTLEGRPFVFPGAPSQTVDIELAGQVVTTLTLRRRLSDYRLTLPRELLRLGKNRIGLRYGYHRRPRDVGVSSGKRSLAVAWYSLTIESAGPATRARPQVDLASARLFLPPGLGLDFHLSLEPRTELVAEGWSFRGATRLDVLLESEGGEEVLVASLREAPAGGRLALPGEARQIARLTLRTVPEGTVDVAKPGILLSRPRLEAVPRSLPAEAPSAPRPAGEAPLRPHLLIYMIDTLRADHLGCYGYEKDLTPAIDRFARGAVLFEHAIAQSSWTRASVASIFTGLWPLAHGANRRGHVLSEEAVTLPETLAEHGYRTAAFITNPNVGEEFGLGQGFDEFFDLGGEEVDGIEVTRAVEEWLDQRSDEDPFFLYLHTIDPHSPYDPPPEYRQRFAPEVPLDVTHTPNQLARAVRRGRLELEGGLLEEIVGLYDAEIAYLDYAFGELLEGLEERGLAENTVIVVVSDHGEEFFEHGNFEHGKTLFEESLHVPLIIRPTGPFEPRREARPVQHIDLLPTLLELLALPVPAVLEGSSLVPSMHGESWPSRPVFTYLHLDASPRIGIFDEGWKLIQRIKGGRLIQPRLHFLAEDPGELHNRMEEHPVRGRYLAARLRRRLVAPEPRLESHEAEIDDGLRQRLEALGYLQ